MTSFTGWKTSEYLSLLTPPLLQNSSIRIPAPEGPHFGPSSTFWVLFAPEGPSTGPSGACSCPGVFAPAVSVPPFQCPAFQRFASLRPLFQCPPFQSRRFSPAVSAPASLRPLFRIPAPEGPKCGPSSTFWALFAPEGPSTGP